MISHVERHKNFEGCPTAKQAREAIARLDIDNTAPCQNVTVSTYCGRGTYRIPRAADVFSSNSDNVFLLVQKHEIPLNKVRLVPLIRIQYNDVVLHVHAPTMVVITWGYLQTKKRREMAAADEFYMGEHDGRIFMSQAGIFYSKEL